MLSALTASPLAPRSVFAAGRTRRGELQAKIVALLGSLVLTGCATSWTTVESRYVSLGPRTGYYIVEPGSPLFYKLGLEDAPWIDTADTFRHGYGADVLAFRFNRNGILIAPPAYIAQESVNDFYTRRIGAFIRDRSTTHEVEAMFGHGHSIARRPDGFIYYYVLPIYNAAEDRGGGRH